MAESFTFKATATGFDSIFETVIDQAKDITPALRRFDKTMRPDIQRVFAEQGPGWAPLDEKTLDKRTANLPASTERIRAGALNKLSRSVKRTYNRAVKSLNRTSQDAKLFARRRKTLAKQAEQYLEVSRIAEQQRQATMGSVAPGKKFSSLGKRVDKYRDRAEARITALANGELLGRIASSIKSTVAAGSLTIESKIPWAGIQNKGGKAGNGATLPQRTFLEWTPERIARFVAILQDYLLEDDKT